ncbi:hypothetical protein CC85DRAFT_287857 [Cutaneotrichosporon oleaginosum]|uniref:Mitochondrial escape protein 2 n=1 Tax=Cutaneotrichosporon oleaginosum TaxID=879819 RepID=A0A0J0XG96_9TREE|nr:uncharacterized protein CC85DRAFT_287857 [Cutaneotrichosporon oleaginosum]KLT40067.1 hypothetical protein CC85DRAFT_287857 [Cutaneotrichosporon oleaginosum]TXT10401.1 hypothetical protein COLE_04335 [Cutaneotrichosporon oleaginosum]
MLAVKHPLRGVGVRPFLQPRLAPSLISRARGPSATTALGLRFAATVPPPPPTGPPPPSNPPPPASNPPPAADPPKDEVPEHTEHPADHEHTDAHVPEGYDEGSAGQVQREHCSVFISQVLPIRLGSWDPRPWVASWYEGALLAELVNITNDLKGRHAFKVESWEVARKDGGVFCHFSYVPPALDQLPRKAFDHDFHTPEEAIPDPVSPSALFLPLFIEAAHKHGGWPTWIGPWWSSLLDGTGINRRASACSNEAGHYLFSGDLAPPKGADGHVPELRGWQRTAGAGRVWMVRGRQWTEDMNRFPSARLRVEFDGPDVSQEVLYTLFRPYGRIHDIAPPTPVPAGQLRSALVTFRRISTAVNANNALHGFNTHIKSADYEGRRSDAPLTRLRIYFERPLKAHYFRDWVSNHPRIALPVLAFLIGMFSYTFFDPIREFFVKARIEGMWNLEQYPTVQFIKDNIVMPVKNTLWPAKARRWKRNVDDLGRASFRDRVEAERNVERWLTEFPSTFIVVTGPPGSGKHDLVDRVLKDEKKPNLVIDCAEIGKAKSDTALVDGLASQTGYWPVFSFLQSINGLIDLASMGLIGQKSGFSTPADQQMRNILDIVASALKEVSSHAREKRASEQQHQRDEINLAADRERQQRLIEQGIWHDGRLDCVAGNGIMSELGFGIEQPSELDVVGAAPLMGSTAPIAGEAVPPTGVSIAFDKEVTAATQVAKAEEEVDSDAELIKTLPVVVLRNFAFKPARGELWNVMAEWGASLIENKVAHVIVVGEGSVASKTLTAALPSKPLNQVNLSDADDYNALEFVREKLSTDGHQVELTAEETADVAKLGGRMVDLELLVYKVRSGQSLSTAVEDIVLRNAVEIRKTAFGDDSDEAKALPWTRAQAWKIVSALAKQPELSYAQLLSEFPFKGADTCLKAMEEHGLIFITAGTGGRTCPAMVRPGKPVFRESFRSLVDEPIFHAMCQIEYNAAVTKKAEADIADYEAELAKLKSITSDGDHLGVAAAGWFGAGSPIHQRAQYLAESLGKSMDKIRKAEADSAEQIKAFTLDGKKRK